VTITINNNKTTAVTEVTVNDLIPTGTTLVPGSINGIDDFQTNENTLVFDLGVLPPGALRRISYRLQSDPMLFSNRIFFDDAEVIDATWSISDLAGSDTWRISIEQPFEGERSWFVPSTPRSNDQTIRLVQPLRVDASQPVLRFYHDYNIEPGLDGGLIEISSNGGISWAPLSREQIFREPYTGRVAPNTFGVNRQDAYWGESPGYVATYVDLSDFIGERINLRFRYSTNLEPELTGFETEGWYIDNIEIMDMFNYATEVCLTTAQGDNICQAPEQRGTIVETALPTSSQEIIDGGFQVQVFPNPVQNILNIQMQGTNQDNIQLEVTSLNGQTLLLRSLDGSLPDRMEQLDLSDLPKGVYFLKVSSAENIQVEKIVVQ
ncbi:MAG: T9SS type A sorting domain-containing protein, partial [Bacteroidota bacterium]